MSKTKGLLTALAIMVAAIISICAVGTDPTPHETYCMVMGEKQMFSTKMTITVDYGEPKKWLSDTRIKDETGKVQSFNSMVDALNYMAEKGWVFVCAYPITTGNTLTYHYTMRKTVTEE